jgi:DNA-binding response OmpR family regulator
VTKPFNPRELVARVKSILRRSTPARTTSESAEIRHGDLHVDSGRREAHVGETEIQLAPKEFDLLWELLDHRGIVLTRDQLLERVWGYTFAGDTRTVDVHVRQSAASSAMPHRSSPSGASATRCRLRGTL